MTQTTTLKIDQDVLDTMEESARRDQPRETCALLLGDENRIDQYYEMTNVNRGLDELLDIEGIDAETFESVRGKLSLHGEQPGTLDVNEASVEALADLDGLDAQVAERIVDRRRRVGKFEDPKIHFKFDPGEQVKAQRDAIKNGKDVVGVYHSHPHHDSEAYPSEDDQRMGHAGYIYFILNFQPEDTIIRAFEMDDGGVSERSFEVVKG